MDGVNVMIMDCHIHLLPGEVRLDRTMYVHSDAAFGSLYSSPKARLASEEDIISYMDDSGIEKAVVFGFPWESHDLISKNNDEVWEFAQRNPARIYPFAVLSPEVGDRAYRETERIVSAGFAGIGELAMYHGGWSAAGFEALSPCLEMAGSAGIPVMLHVNEPVGHEYPGKISVDFQGLLQLIGANPEVTFILAHFGGGIFVYGLMPEVAGVLARTYVDTAASPYLYDARVYDVATKVLGQDKILFGSDFPLLAVARYLKHIEQSGIGKDAQKAILGENLARLLSLSH
jgi:predicted TIM-barrel fold metal-dependent hydrolase